MTKIAKVTGLLLCCALLACLSIYAKDAAHKEKGDKVKLDEYLDRGALPKDRNRQMGELKNLKKFFDDKLKGSILNLSEREFGVSFVTIQRSCEHIERQQSIIKDSLESLRGIEKQTESCMTLQGEALINKLGLIALRTYVIQQLVALDADYNKDEAAKKLEKIRRIIKDKILTQKDVLADMPESGIEAINNVLKMAEDGIAAAKDKRQAKTN